MSSVRPQSFALPLVHPDYDLFRVFNNRCIFLNRRMQHELNSLVEYLKNFQFNSIL
jgi:hypothetical protein